MQILAPCGFQCTYLKCLPTTHEQLGVTRIGAGTKNNRISMSLAKGSHLQVKPLPSSVLGGGRPSWRAAVSTQDEIASGDVDKTTIVEDAKKTVEEKGEPLVKVKFVLQKKCRFGQQFKVIGSDPLFGTWDPKAAIPLEWSEGDEWTKEVDVPVGKQIEYKFLLTDKRGGLVWQPGPNRTFETLPSDSPLVVSSAWELDEEIAAVAKDEGALVDEATEEGDTDKTSDTKLVEGLSLNVPSGEGTSERQEISSETSNQGLGLSAKNTEDHAEGKDSVVDFSGAQDVVSVSSGANGKRAASTTEAI